MAYVQQITQEQEALESEPKLKLVHKYLPETETYLSYKHRIKNRRHVLKKLTRAGVAIKAQKTDKTRKLHPKAMSIAETVLNKIAYDGEEEVILTHKYLNKITDCLADQNKRHIEQLANLFDAKYERAYLKDGKFYEYCYVFKLNPEITQELKDAGVLESEFIPAKKPRSINNKDISNEIKIRSSRANFSNSNFNSKNTNTELVENSSGVAKGVSLNSSTDTQIAEQAETLHEPQAVEATSPTQTPSTRQMEDTPRPSNVVRNGFLGGSKHISEIQLYLTDELCETLRSKSGKLFTNQAIRQITKAIAASKRGQYVEFKHVNGIISYLTPALANEKRDPNKIGSGSYYTLAGMTAEDKIWRQQENYLEGVEQMAMRHVSPENQFKGKLVGTLERSVAYNLLLAIQNTAEVGNMLVISLNRQIELTEQQRNVVLAQAQAVFNLEDMQGNGRAIESVEFVVKAFSWQNKGSTTNLSVSCNQQIELPKGNWGKACGAFVSEYGSDLYHYWLAGLEVTENSEKGTIELRTTSGMVRDRIEQTYLPFLVKVAGEFGINKVEFVV